MPGLFFDFHYPVELRNLLEKMVRQREEGSQEHAVVLDNNERYWLSQPRPSSDSTVENVTVNFKLPLSISHISADFLRRQSSVEFWYRDRSNNWRRVLDKQRAPLSVTLSGSSSSSWYTYKSDVYPIVAKSLQVRLRREEGVGDPSRPYSLGVRNVLIKRNIHDRSQGVQPLEVEQDLLGNVTSRFIKDWDANRAADGEAGTFWKSSPQPDPSAVVSLYTDVRDEDGNPSLVDKVYIDPVYKGQQLNVYYSTDDTVGERRLSPITVRPKVDTNTEWKQTVGRRDLNGTAPAEYAFESFWGPLRSADTWVGIEWSPDFDSDAGPSVDPVLLKVSGTEIASPKLTYSSGDRAFVLSFSGTNLTLSYELDEPFEEGDTLRIVVGWKYSPSKDVYVKVVNQSKKVLVEETRNYESLPDVVSFDNEVSIEGFRGLYTAMVIKLEDYTQTSQRFLDNPQMYVSPDPVLPDANGERPSTSLDNAIFATDWTMQEHGTGGRDDSEYGQKVWSPIWRDYTVEKGFLYFPKPVLAKYLKFEITNLTEEPYPIYESGVDVQYKVFPINVQQVSSRGPRLNVGSGVGGLFNAFNVNGVKSVNWFDFTSVHDALQQVLGRTYEPVNITPGAGYITGTVPNTYDAPIRESYGIELAANALNRRTEFDSYILARNEAYTTIKGEGLLKIAPYTDIPWEEIYEANPRAIETTQQPGALAVRGSDWWIFPGQTLKIPASVMEGLTKASTVLEIKATLERRVRFMTNSVHRYDVRTVRRDAAIAYFAGIREITPYTSSFIAEEDRDSYDFQAYTSPPWQKQGLEMLPNGVTTSPEGVGIATFNFKTSSTFAKMKFDFRDSGYAKSDAMWEEEGTTKLSYNTKIQTFDGTVWTDIFAGWSDETAPWGSPRSLVSVTVDSDRVYRGKRVLKFSRLRGAGEAGIKIRQQTNYTENGCLARICATLYKPYQNDNQIIVRLVHEATGDVIFEDYVDASFGKWVEYRSSLFEVPAVEEVDPTYRVEMSMIGDEQDEILLNDFYTETSHIRYYVAPGPKTGDTYSPEDLIDVTELREETNAAFVCPEPVREATVIATLTSNRQFLFGMTVKPTYLQ